MLKLIKRTQTSYSKIALIPSLVLAVSSHGQMAKKSSQDTLQEKTQHYPLGRNYGNSEEKKNPFNE